MARHWMSSFRCTPSAWKQHMLQRRHGQLLRDFHLKHLCVLHAQRVCIPRGADVVHQVSLQPPPLKQTVALQDPDRYIASAPCLFAVEGRRGKALTVAVGASQPAAPTVQFQGRCVASTGNRVSMSSGTFGSDKYLVGRYARCTQDSSPGPTSRRQECETPFKQTPGADMERQGQSGPEAARVARLQPRHRCQSVPCLSSSPCEGACELSRVDW